MPGDDTADGTYLTIEKANPTLMSGPGYKNVPVYWSVRFTWSGNYYHSAPWSVGEQGFTNVSHGCVNLSPKNAQWYYERSNPGDPITITGSPVAGKWDDGYTEWFLSWPQLLRSSATHEAVQVSLDRQHLRQPRHAAQLGVGVHAARFQAAQLLHQHAAERLTLQQHRQPRQPRLAETARRGCLMSVRLTRPLQII